MDPVEDVFPIENGDFPSSYVRKYQRGKKIQSHGAHGIEDSRFATPFPFDHHDLCR